jgi:hypothetical protein
VEHAYPVIEFETEIAEGGTLAIPRAAGRVFAPGTTVIVRLTRGIVGGRLRRRGVTEDEIEQIAARQLEPRENVIRFLEAEGSLSGSARLRRRGRLS